MSGKSEKSGHPLPLGVSIHNGHFNFAVAASGDAPCYLLLYEKEEEGPVKEILMPGRFGDVRTLKLETLPDNACYYNYKLGNEILVDPYVKALYGRKEFGVPLPKQSHLVKGILNKDTHVEATDNVFIETHIIEESIIYSIHVRGFTKDASSKVKYPGTFAGVIEKLPYIKGLGVTALHLMPVYEFEECLQYTNYWGYGDGWFFSPKESYGGDEGLKALVDACHVANLEIFLEMPFGQDTPAYMMSDALRYYRLTYAIDGFFLNPERFSIEEAKKDPLLAGAKIMRHDGGFSYVMRRYLKGDEGMMNEVMFRLGENSCANGYPQEITSHSGFTLNDLVSYDGKHNEANGENNTDGADYNFSWNCGVEGKTKKQEINKLRRQQVRNAFALLLLSRGTPMILSGDEFYNSQDGNNNVYCQDNPTGWTNWKRGKAEKDLTAYVRDLIKLRKEIGVFTWSKRNYKPEGVNTGLPQVSWHGDNLWVAPTAISSRQIGVYYCGTYTGSKDCMVLYNLHWEAHDFALPKPREGKVWTLRLSTADGVYETQSEIKDQRMISVPARTIYLLSAK
ncbi:MAG: glycogen debranching protein [Lachnospiraceae bacterium]|nr:glycogen debranching protein [Lachnospiraceae bacterium]